MADTGFVVPTSAQTVNYNSGETWTNPANITTDNTSTVAYADPTRNEETYWLVGYNYDFASAGLTSVDTITGIEVQIEHRGESTNIEDDVVQLFQSTTPTGDDKANNASIGTTFVDTNYGGSTDTWNASLSASDILDTGFGAGIVYTNTITQLFQRWVEVNTIRIKIYYSASGTIEWGATAFTTSASIVTAASGITKNGATSLTPSTTIETVGFKVEGIISTKSFICLSPF